jgi:hypothetical protein
MTFPFRGTLWLTGDLEVSRSDLQSTGDTAATTITGLTVWAPTVALGTPLTPWLRAEARVGALFYAPSDRAGNLFSDGAPVEPALGIGLFVERALGRWLRGALHARYDIHRFTTATLEARGFDGKTVVHRVGISVSLSRRFGDGSDAH